MSLTVKELVFLIYKELPKQFYSSDLLRKVKSFPKFSQVHDDTIHRKLRELRSDNRINYDVIDRKKSLYLKRREPIGN